MLWIEIKFNTFCRNFFEMGNKIYENWEISFKKESQNFYMIGVFRLFYLYSDCVGWIYKGVDFWITIKFYFSA